jgi:hypothetical protein
MDEDILAAVVRGDVAEALRVIEPLHFTCAHLRRFLASNGLESRAAASAALRSVKE